MVPMARLPPEIDVGPRLRIPASEVSLSYARSGGPGGQHVNKTSSKVILRWNVRGSAVLGDEVRARLEEKLASRLTEAGDLLITSERYRDQARNVDDAVEKLVATLRGALARPKPRKATRPTRASQRRRVDEKRRRGARKRERRAPPE